MYDTLNIHNVIGSWTWLVSEPVNGLLNIDNVVQCNVFALNVKHMYESWAIIG